MTHEEKSNAGTENGWELLTSEKESLEGAFMDYIYPKVSVVIPTYNCSQLISLTIDKVLVQEYPDFEIIIIDAGSTDSTLDIINSFYSDKIRISTVTQFQRFEMLNKGISLARGEYLSFLFPGEFYLQNQTARQMMNLAIESDKPHLVYGAGLIRRPDSDVMLIYRELSTKLLKKGFQPTSLESCFFRSDLFPFLGKFRPDLELRGGYEIFCRFSLSPGLQHVSTSQVVTDYEYRSFTRKKLILHFKETLKTIYRHFGFLNALRWLFTQNDLFNLAKMWLNSLKLAFLGQHQK